MGLRVAINGLGRIGRLVTRLLSFREDLTLVAVNDLITPDHLAYLIDYDSTHGRFKGSVKGHDGVLEINQRPIVCLSEKDPAALPWKKLEVDYVIDATGVFTSAESLAKHIEAGARRVILTAPAKGDLPTFVMGVNHHSYDPKKDQIVSNASCTTNCLAPMMKVLLDQFGVEEGLMTTIHATTASQPTVDGAAKKDWRGGRGAMQNIIPASTGAAKAVALCLPELKGKITGMAFRVPVADVSVVDLTVKLQRASSYEEVCRAMKDASEGFLKGILGYTEHPVVSSDFIGTHYSAIFDQGAGIGLNSHFYKLVAWYDNEMGYARRVVDLMDYMGSRELL